MNPKPLLKLAPEARLVMTFALRQALEILQMPQLELGQWLLHEIEKNPLLELDATTSKRPFTGEFPAKPTLLEHLTEQIRDHFPDLDDQQIAFNLLHQLDERGFLPIDVKDHQILSVLQTFDPPGVFARSHQESFLLQLKAKGLKGSLAYTLIEKCYDDLLKGRFTAIQKKLKTSNLKEALVDFTRLTLRPASVFHEEPVNPVTPDLQIQRIEGGWTIELVEDDLPKFHIREEYLEIKGETEEEKELLREFKTEAKWIVRSVNRRRKILQEIGNILLRKQAQFLDQKGPLSLITIKELAEKLHVHESTLSRALSSKYVATPRGILPLKSLIDADPVSTSAKETLERLIATEDKQKPLTDEELAALLKEKGFPIARRTIAKYRNKLKIGTATQRKHQ